MSEPRYPNESPEYRQARDELLEDEKALVEIKKALAEKRRRLRSEQVVERCSLPAAAAPGCAGRGALGPA